MKIFTIILLHNIHQNQSPSLNPSFLSARKVLTRSFLNKSFMRWPAKEEISSIYHSRSSPPLLCASSKFITTNIQEYQYFWHLRSSKWESFSSCLKQTYFSVVFLEPIHLCRKRKMRQTKEELLHYVSIDDLSWCVVQVLERFSVSS